MYNKTKSLSKFNWKMAASKCELKMRIFSFKYVPAQVSPTTPRNTSPAAAAIARRKKLLNSDFVIKLCRYLRAAYA